MYIKTRKAFTMIELVFVIVVIGILSAIAIPKFAATRDDATITKARATISSVRSALSTERQKRILRGDFSNISNLAYDNGNNKPIFDYFDGNNTAGHEVLEYPLRSCVDSSARGCWKASSSSDRYLYRMPHNATNVRFDLSNNRLVCHNPNNADCKLLTQ
jgi:general secretion pathway protein G